MRRLILLIPLVAILLIGCATPLNPSPPDYPEAYLTADEVIDLVLVYGVPNINVGGQVVTPIGDWSAQYGDNGVWTVAGGVQASQYTLPTVWTYDGQVHLIEMGRLSSTPRVPKTIPQPPAYSPPPVYNPTPSQDYYQADELRRQQEELKRLQEQQKQQQKEYYLGLARMYEDMADALVKEYEMTWKPGMSLQEIIAMESRYQSYFRPLINQYRQQASYYRSLVY